MAAAQVEFGDESGDSLSAGSCVMGKGPELPDDALRRLSPPVYEHINLYVTTTIR